MELPMKKFSTYLLSLLVAVAFSLANANAQDSTYQLLSESTMIIEGTSTIHDWEADVEEMNLSIDFTNDVFESAVPSSSEFIKELTFTVPVKSLESGKGKMNSKIYEAFNEKKHPEIKYVFSSAELTDSDENSGSFTLNATGDLTMAGTTKTVSFPVEGSFTDSENIRFEGTYSLNMEDYGMERPSAVFGTIKSGAEVTITFDIVIADQSVANNQ